MGKRKHPPVALSKEVAEILKFVRLTNDFRSIERLIWYRGVEGRERNGEHVFQLTIVAWFIQQRHLPHLDLLKVLLYAIVHDMPEVYAADTPAFADKSGTYTKLPSRGTKARREAEAIERLRLDWRDAFPDMFFFLTRYERGADEESRFVNALDKFVAELNIYDDNGRTDKRLQLTLAEKVNYKRPRIAVHPPTLTFYDAFTQFCEHRPELFFVPKTKAAAS